MRTRSRRRQAVGTALVVVALSTWLGVGPVGAHSATEAEKEQIEARIESVQAQVLEASKEEARLLAQIDESASRKAAIDARVAAIGGELHELEHRVEDAEARLAQVERELAAAKADLVSSQDALEQSRARLVEYAIDAYTGRNETNRLMASIIEANTLAELSAKRAYVKVVGESQAELIGERERLRDEVSDLTQRLEAAEAEAEDQRDAVSAHKAEVQVKFDEQAAVQAEAASELATTQGLRREVVSRKAEFEAEIQELQRRSEEIAELLRRRAAEVAGSEFTPSGGPGGGGLLHPIPGARVASPFGMRVHPIYGDARMHTGVDLSAGSGTPIQASGDGVVVRAGPFGGYGNATIIDHGGGIATLYAHQSSIGVSSGQRVSAGAVIGRVGCTGACTGPHLHFEVRLNGSPVNPMPYIT